MILGIGTPTGLCDSDGHEIKIGDKIKQEVSCNKDFHGEWAIYEIKFQGIVPILSYDISAKGQVLPKGYLGVVLSDQYDSKNFIFATDSKQLKPIIDMFIIEDKTIIDKNDT